MGRGIVLRLASIAALSQHPPIAKNDGSYGDFSHHGSLCGFGECQPHAEQIVGRLRREGKRGQKSAGRGKKDSNLRPPAS